MSTDTVHLDNTRIGVLGSVYAHLVAAILSVLLLEWALFAGPLAESIARPLVEVNWMLLLAAFLVAGWMARRLAHRVRTTAAQYAGLALYVVAFAVILVPLLYRSEAIAPGAIAAAGRLTLGASLALTIAVFATGKNFSFLRSVIVYGGFLALAFIVVAAFTPLRLGVWFSLAMIALSGASILYDTSRMLRQATPGREPAYALELFAAVAMMFWYALRLLRQVRG